MDLETKNEITKLREEQKSWFDSMEQLLIKHADTPPKSISGFMQEIQTNIKTIKDDVQELKDWKIETSTERKVFNWIWGSIGSFVVLGVITGIIGYIKLPETIRNTSKEIIQEELDNKLDSKVLDVLEKYDKINIIKPYDNEKK